MLELAAEQGLPVYFLGAAEGVAEEAARRQAERLPGLLGGRDAPRLLLRGRGGGRGPSRPRVRAPASFWSAMGAPRQEVLSIGIAISSAWRWPWAWAAASTCGRDGEAGARHGPSGRRWSGSTAGSRSPPATPAAGPAPVRRAGGQVVARRLRAAAPRAGLGRRQRTAPEGERQTERRLDRRRRLRYLISGYYGERNAGDEAILAGILQEIDRGTPSAVHRALLRPGRHRAAPRPEVASLDAISTSLRSPGRLRSP